MIIDMIVKWQRCILECQCKHYINTTSTTVTTTTHVLFLLSEKSKLYWYMYDMQTTLKFLCISRLNIIVSENPYIHDDVIKWKHFPRYSPFVQGIHRSPLNSPHKGQWRGALMHSLICVLIDVWENNREASDLRCYHAHYDVTLMFLSILSGA